MGTDVIMGFAIAVVIVAAFAYWLWGYPHADWEAFEKIFGFKLPFAKEGPDKIREAQRKVDEVLEVLAEVYAKTDLYEREVVEAAKKAQSPFETRAHKINLGRARQAVKQAKAKFWKAHAVAKAFGFRVREKYTSYLSIEMHRKVLGLHQPQRGGRRYA